MKGFLTLRGSSDELASHRAQKVLWTANYCNVTIAQGVCPTEELDSLKKYTKMAKGLVLSYEADEDNSCHLTMSTAMIKFIASLAPSSGLMGRDYFEAHQVDGWLSYIWHSLDLPIHAWEASHQEDPRVRGTIQKLIVAGFQCIQSHLENSKTSRMVGSGFTLADLSLVVSLQHVPAGLLKDNALLASWLKQQLKTLDISKGQHLAT